MSLEEVPTYAPLIRDLHEHDRPRERLLAVGANAVSSAELLAIILRPFMQYFDMEFCQTF